MELSDHGSEGRNCLWGLSNDKWLQAIKDQFDGHQPSTKGQDILGKPNPSFRTQCLLTRELDGQFIFVHLSVTVDNYSCIDTSHSRMTQLNKQAAR